MLITTFRCISEKASDFNAINSVWQTSPGCWVLETLLEATQPYETRPGCSEHCKRSKTFLEWKQLQWLCFLWLASITDFLSAEYSRWACFYKIPRENPSVFRFWGEGKGGNWRKRLLERAVFQSSRIRYKIMNHHRTLSMLIVQFSQAQRGEWQKGDLCHVIGGRFVYQIKARG